MAQVINKENIVVVIGEYNDRQTGQAKKQFRTIGELITMQGDDGSQYQFGKIWGPHGCTEFKVYAQEDRKSAVNNAQPQQQGGYNQSGYNDNPPF